MCNMKGGFKLKDLNSLMNPKSVAIVGASPDFTKLNGMPLKYILVHQYSGNIYPVNPKYKEIKGIKCYPTISDLPDHIDVAEILVGSGKVIDVLAQCAQKKVKSAIVFSSGFDEIGSRGGDVQKKMKAIAEETGMIIHGPNCNGIVNFVKKIPLSFTPILNSEKLYDGKVGLISQSGGLGSHTLLHVFGDRHRSLRFSYYIGTGNEAALTLEDYLEFLVNDENTEVIACIVEGFRNGRRFMEISDQAFDRRKPIVILKLGVSEIGKNATMSHTAVVSGSRFVIDGLFKQKGILGVQTLEDLIDSCALFEKFKDIKSCRVGIITDSGGGAGLTADACDRYALSLPPLNDTMLKEIGTMMAFGNPGNPLDLTGQSVGDVNLFEKSLELFYRSPDFDIIVIVIAADIPEGVEKQAATIIQQAEIFNKPTLTIFGVASSPRVEEAIEALKAKNIVVFPNIDSCFRAISNLAKYCSFQSNKLKMGDDTKISFKPVKSEDIRKVASGEEVGITEPEGSELLNKFGLPFANSRFVKSLNGAVKAAKEVGYPVVLKAVSPQISHKTEAKAVRLNVRNRMELEKAYHEVIANSKKFSPAADIKGVLVQEMINDGVEVIMGFAHDDQFGPVVVFGLGGIFVEVLKDVSFRIAPITRYDATEMIRGIKGYEILTGARNRKEADIDAIIESLIKISRMAMETSGYLRELDLNPVFVFEKGKGIKVVDYLFVMNNSLVSQ